MQKMFKNTLRNFLKDDFPIYVIWNPLLHNLMKNPENEYIKWPGRTDIIQSQINKIVAITRGV